MRSKVHPKYRTEYRAGNRSDHDRALVLRGEITVWISDSAIRSWVSARSGRRGGQQKYSDLAIETVVTLRLIFHLPLRQAEGGQKNESVLAELEAPSVSDHTAAAADHDSWSGIKIVNEKRRLIWKAPR